MTQDELNMIRERTNELGADNFRDVYALIAEVERLRNALQTLTQRETTYCGSAADFARRALERKEPQ